MARVTIEDCRKHISNRFELVILASHRAKDLSLGIPPLIQKSRDKDPVLALREIAAGKINCDKLRELVITKYIDPMKRTLQGIKSNIELEEIFKDLAESIDLNEQVENGDGYEHDEIIQNDFIEHVHSSDEDSEDLEDDLEEIPPIKEQQFDVDVSFDDEDVED
jgi:DNA-directed RNA polymerase subunit omega